VHKVSILIGFLVCLISEASWVHLFFYCSPQPQGRHLFGVVPFHSIPCMVDRNKKGRTAIKKWRYRSKHNRKQTVVPFYERATLGISPVSCLLLSSANIDIKSMGRLSSALYVRDPCIQFGSNLHSPLDLFSSVRCGAVRYTRS
jgi:hypothetical protein